MTGSSFREARIRLGLPAVQAVGIVGLGLATALCEAGGVLMILPALEFVQGKGTIAPAVAESSRWVLLRHGFDALGLPVTLAGLLMLAFLAILARQVMQFVQKVQTSKVRCGLVSRVRLALLSGFLRADLAAVESDPQGRLVSDFTTEVDTAVTCLMYSLQFAVLIGIFSIYLVSLLSLSWPMTLMCLGVLVLTAFAIRGVFRRTFLVGAQTVESNQDVGSFLVERIRSLRLIRLSGTEKAELDHAARLLDRQARMRIKAERISAELAASVEPLFIGFAFFCLWLGATQLNLSLEVLGIFLVIVLRLVPIGKDLLGARQVVLQTRPSLAVVVDRLGHLARSAESQTGRRPFNGLDAEIRFDDVSFTHEGHAGQAKALSGVSVRIPARSRTAIVGPSGGGKSTFVDLLPRLRVPQTGRILFDGHPLEEYDLSSLRDGIAFVSQSATVFDVTAAEHIGYGRPNASEAEVESAARRAHAWDFLARMPDGLRSRLGETGSRLSGGQKQRLDLARALARDARVLILDEPTSALDAESEQALTAALDELAAARSTTILVIAHRLATIAGSDQIIVLEDGRVSQTGTHAELLASGGWYARAWSLQQEPSARVPGHDQLTPSLS